MTSLFHGGGLSDILRGLSPPQAHHYVCAFTAARRVSVSRLLHLVDLAITSLFRRVKIFDDDDDDVDYVLAVYAVYIYNACRL